MYLVDLVETLCEWKIKKRYSHILHAEKMGKTENEEWSTLYGGMQSIDMCNWTLTLSV